MPIIATTQNYKIDHRKELRGALQEVAKRLEKVEGIRYSSQVIHNRIKRNHIETLKVYAEVLRDMAIEDNAKAAMIEKIKQDIQEAVS